MPGFSEPYDYSDVYGFGASDVDRIAKVVSIVEGKAGANSFLRSAAQDKNYAKVPFKNSNAGTAPAFGVLRVTGTTAVDQFNFLTIDQPDSTYRWLYLVNGTEDVPANGYGWGTWLWHGGRVLYGSGTPAYGNEYGPTASAWTLQPNAPGFYIQGGQDTTLTTCIAVQVVPGELRVKNDTGGDIAAAGSGTFSIYSDPSTDTGLNITANNDMSIAFKSNKFGAVSLLAGRAQVITWQT